MDFDKVFEQGLYIFSKAEHLSFLCTGLKGKVSLSVIDHY